MSRIVKNDSDYSFLLRFRTNFYDLKSRDIRVFNFLKKGIELKPKAHLTANTTQITFFNNIIKL